MTLVSYSVLLSFISHLGKKTVLYFWHKNDHAVKMISDRKKN